MVCTDRQSFAQLVTAAWRSNAFAEIRMGGKRRTAREGSDRQGLWQRPRRARDSSSAGEAGLQARRRCLHDRGSVVYQRLKLEPSRVSPASRKTRSRKTV